MTADIEAAKAHIDGILKERRFPGSVTSEITNDEVIVNVTGIPFIHHGMEFKSAVLLHFTMQLAGDGTYRTYWGKHDWADGAPLKTENASEVHDALEPAAAWIEQMIADHAHTGRANAMPNKGI